ncbi:hypothetical protein MVEN_01999800 [Mycena venus]|uniref:Uncharacterized protein n=1 Tax=Mycena venus TaxID=2733690 RepID=A0A8H7CL13_9AGAR|nr:hypothetical protein MVEN_01999800 [Mycena venus]
MAYYNSSVPTTGGPNDPQPPQLSPEQWAHAYRQFQYQLNPQLPTPPPPPHLPLPGPVIDPALQPSQDTSTDQRLDALEREVELLRAEKRTNPETPAGPSKKRRKKQQKPSLYILRHSTGLSKEQNRVRGQLMKKVKTEGMRLTGRTTEPDSEADDESDSPTTHTPHPVMSYNFAATVEDPINVKIFNRIADLIWTEQHDPKSATFSLAHADVLFTREDLVEFAKTNFRSWKTKWRGKNDPEVAQRQAKAAQKDPESESNQGPEYKKKFKRDPICVLETDWMSDEISGPDTDDEDTKADHRRRLVKAARLGPLQQNDDVWEVVRPGFQSLEMSETKDDLDKIVKEQRDNKPKRVRGRVTRISFGNTHDRLPAGTIYPFMLSQSWYDEHIEGNEELENEMKMYTKDPKGFGDS